MTRIVNLPKRPSVDQDGQDAPSGAEPDYIAENLRKLFGAIEAEPLPARFETLLARLAHGDDEGEDEA
jgi:hypothetical protein